LQCITKLLAAVPAFTEEVLNLRKLGFDLVERDRHVLAVRATDVCESVVDPREQIFFRSSLAPDL
jgi:hypothetical protein